VEDSEILSPPLEKGGEGGFLKLHGGKNELMDRGLLSYRTVFPFLFFFRNDPVYPCSSVSHSVFFFDSWANKSVLI
jgi:hypothetical protein